MMKKDRLWFLLLHLLGGALLFAKKYTAPGAPVVVACV
jgi:hypothetical protein